MKLLSNPIPAMFASSILTVLMILAVTATKDPIPDVDEPLRVEHTYRVIIPTTRDCSEQSEAVSTQVSRQCYRWSNIHDYERCSEDVREQMCKPVVPGEGLLTIERVK